MDIKNKFVVGLAFTVDLHQLVLIKKRKEAINEGYWNGVGGRIQNFLTPKNELYNYQEQWVEETPHAAMSREFQEETGVFIPEKDWHCFHIQTWQHTKTKVYFLYTASNEVLKCKTMTDEEVKLWPFPSIDFWDDKIVYDLPYLIEMCLTHVRKGDIFCLNPEGINLERQNPTGLMGSSVD